MTRASTRASRCMRATVLMALLAVAPAVEVETTLSVEVSGVMPTTMPPMNTTTAPPPVTAEPNTTAPPATSMPPLTTAPPVTLEPNTTAPDVTSQPPSTTAPSNITAPPATTRPPATTKPPETTAPPATQAPPATTTPPPSTTPTTAPPSNPPTRWPTPPTPTQSSTYQPPHTTAPSFPATALPAPATSQLPAQRPSVGSPPTPWRSSPAPISFGSERSTSPHDSTNAKGPSPVPVTRAPGSVIGVLSPASGTVAGEADEPVSKDGSRVDDESSSSGSEDSSSSSSSSSSASPTPSTPGSSSGSTGESGKRTPTATARTSQKKSRFHDFAVYTGVSLAAVSVALLVIFHVFAFDSPWLNWPHEWQSTNGWELLLYVCYLQQIGSLSHLEVLQTPAFLAKFTDALSWTNFLIQRNNIVSTTQRRLADEEVVKGIEAYAARIQISTVDVLVNVVIAAAIILALLVVVFVALMLCGKKEREDKFDIESSVVHNASMVPAKRRGMLWVLGFVVILWFMVLYPFTAMASFELAVVTANVTLAVTLLVIFCGIVLLTLGLVLHAKTDEQLMSINRLKVYGALYADVSYNFRWFFMVTALAQIALGVCVGAVKDEATQLTVAIVIIVGYLMTVLLLSPFTSQTPLYFTASVCLLKITNLSIAFAFVSDKNVSLAGRERAANAILGITLIVLLLWFLRLLAILATFIRLVAERSAYADSPRTPCYPRDSTKGERDASINPILGGSGVYVTIMSPYHGRLGSEYGDSMDSDAPRRTARLAQL